MDVMNPVQTPFHSLKLFCNNIMLQLNVWFKHLSGLSVYKVLNCHFCVNEDCTVHVQILPSVQCLQLG